MSQTGASVRGAMVCAMIERAAWGMQDRRIAAVCLPAVWWIFAPRCG
jgi:hypothetical protein